MLCWHWASPLSQSRSFEYFYSSESMLSYWLFAPPCCALVQSTDWNFEVRLENDTIFTALVRSIAGNMLCVVSFVYAGNAMTAVFTAGTFLVAWMLWFDPSCSAAFPGGSRMAEHSVLAGGVCLILLQIASSMWLGIRLEPSRAMVLVLLGGTAFAVTTLFLLRSNLLGTALTRVQASFIASVVCVAMDVLFSSQMLGTDPFSWCVGDAYKTCAPAIFILQVTPL